MSIAHGIRVLIKSALQMGMKREQYLFTEQAGKHLFVCEPSLNNPGCYVLCPEDELDGENEKFRVFNNKRPHHVTVPDCCFILDPVPMVMTVHKKRKRVALVNAPEEKPERKNVTPKEKLVEFLEALPPERLLRCSAAIKALEKLQPDDAKALVELMGILEFA